MAVVEQDYFYFYKGLRNWNLVTIVNIVFNITKD